MFTMCTTFYIVLLISNECLVECIKSRKKNVEDIVTVVTNLFRYEYKSSWAHELF